MASKSAAVAVEEFGHEQEHGPLFVETLRVFTVSDAMAAMTTSYFVYIVKLGDGMVRSLTPRKEKLKVCSLFWCDLSFFTQMIAYKESFCRSGGGCSRGLAIRDIFQPCHYLLHSYASGGSSCNYVLHV
jgi:hypothetical protein